MPFKMNNPGGGACSCCGPECDTTICVHVIEIAPCDTGTPPDYEGVNVRIFDDDDVEVCEGATGGDGTYCCTVPGAGAYYAKILVSLEDGECEITSDPVEVEACGTETIEMELCVAPYQLNVQSVSGGAINGAVISDLGWTEVGGGVYQKVFCITNCLSFTPLYELGVTADGYHGGCLRWQLECDTTFRELTVKLYPTADWALGNDSCHACGDCLNNTDRRSDMYKKVGQKLTFNGPIGTLGGWVGTPIDMTYLGEFIGYHVWDSGCLSPGGQWRCWRGYECENCVENGISDIQQYIAPITPEDAEGSGEDLLKDFPSARASLWVSADVNQQPFCVFANFINYHDDMCGEGEFPDLCVTTLGFDAPYPGYCFFDNPNFGVECNNPETFNNCIDGAATLTYPQVVNDWNPEPSQFCAPPSHTWTIWIPAGTSGCGGLGDTIEVTWTEA
jgi:hypothetical protein